SGLGLGRTGTNGCPCWETCAGFEPVLESPDRQRHDNSSVDYPDSSRGCERCCGHREAHGVVACVSPLRAPPELLPSYLAECGGREVSLFRRTIPDRSGGVTNRARGLRATGQPTPRRRSL